MRDHGSVPDHHDQSHDPARAAGIRSFDDVGREDLVLEGGCVDERHPLHLRQRIDLGADRVQGLLIEAVAQRLRAVCADWPDDDFRRLIEDIADITIKYEVRISSVYDRRTADRLLTELHDALDRSKDTREKHQGPNGGTVTAIVLAAQQIVGELARRAT